MLNLYFNVGKINETTNRVVLDLDTDKSANALSGKFIIADGLTVEEINTGKSLINFWIEKPTYDKSTRTVNFSGIVPGGFSGKGEMFEFKLSGASFSATTEVINWSKKETKILLNDGLGTEADFVPRDLNTSQLYGAKPINQEVTIDDTPPESFSPLVSSSSDLLEGKNFVAFSTADKQSGIDHYELAEKQSWFPVRASRLAWQKVESPAVLQDQNLSSFVYVKAVDQSGNERIAVIHPLAPTFPFHPYFFFSIIIVVVALISVFTAKKLFKHS